MSVGEGLFLQTLPICCFYVKCHVLNLTNMLWKSNQTNTVILLNTPVTVSMCQLVWLGVTSNTSKRHSVLCASQLLIIYGFIL